MSLRGGINKEIEGFNRSMKNAVLRGMVDRDGNILGTSKTLGYVCAVHMGDEEDESLRWTVDVQEYGDSDNETNVLEEIGVHKGVLLDGLTRRCCGVRIIPLIYSDVVIAKDPHTKQEYIVAYTDAQEVQVDAHEKVVVGVRKHEPFSETPDGVDKDYYELDETGDNAETTYTPEQKEDIVETGDGKTTVTQTASGVEIDVNGKAKIKVVEDNYSISINGKGTIEVDSAGNVKMNGETYSAVLFEKLSQFLTKFIQYVSTATAAGSPLSTAANIAALTSELQSFKSQTVKIGK